MKALKHEEKMEKVERKKGKHNFEKLSKTIIGAALNVHRELGPGFLESIY